MEKTNEFMEVIKAILILDEILTTGHSPLKILGNDGNIYITKTRKHTTEDSEIISEFICNFLCSKWEIYTPECVLVNVSTELINDSSLSKRHKPQYYKDYYCFGSKYMDNVSELELQDLSLSKANKNLFFDLNQFLKIGLFDLWIVNVDRKPSNLNLLKKIRFDDKYDYYAIDHAYAFDTLLYDQLSAELMLSYNESILYSDFAKMIYNGIDEIGFIDIYKSYFSRSIAACEEGLDQYISLISNYFDLEPKHYDNLKSFLFNEYRNGTIFDDFIMRLRL